MYVANIGDSNVVLWLSISFKKCISFLILFFKKTNSQGKGKLLTMEHKATNESEKARVESVGGWVVQNKVMGILSVTRSFGDSSFKKFLLVEPYQTKTEITEKDTHIVIACGGVRKKNS